MNSRNETELIDNELYNVLLEFVAGAIKHLRKQVNQSQIPTIRIYELRKEKDRTRILQIDRPNWWQVIKIRDYRPWNKKKYLKKATEHPFV